MIKKDLILSSKKMYFYILIIFIILICILIISNIVIFILRYRLLQKKLIINDFFYFLDNLHTNKNNINVQMLRYYEIDNDYIPDIDMYAVNLILLLPYINLCNSYQDLENIIQELIEKKHIIFDKIVINKLNFNLVIRHIIWKILLYKSNSSIYNFFIKED